MENHAQILVVNPGSTSTKVGLFLDGEPENVDAIRHDSATLKQYDGIWGQFDFRMNAVHSWLNGKKLALSAVVGMGGLLRSVSGGTYIVNDKMLNDARSNIQGEHASNLGCAMAYELAKEQGCPAFIVDPVSVDEFEPLARISGHPLIERKSLSHALNIHAAAHRAAGELKKPLHETSFVVAHLGGGISISPVKSGRIIDANDASSNGPFSPERTGTLPLQQFVTLCFSGKYSESEMRSLVMGGGGLVAYLGTNSALQVEKMIAKGDAKAALLFEAMAYQMAKEIGAMSTVLKGILDGIILTGGLATSSRLVKWISERVDFLAPIFVYPGEDELKALALGALRVLRNEEESLDY